MTGLVAAMLFVFGLGLSSTAAVQQSSLMPEGTSSISGHVIAADTRKPIANALVEIVVYNNVSARFRQVTTDAQGKFQFEKLPGGQYQLAAQAAHYVRLQYGQQQAGAAGLLNPPRTIDLRPAQAFNTADFALVGYCAIEGTVVDEFGDPVPNVAIQVSQLQYAGGRRRLVPATSSADAGPARPTDDRGRFRVGGLVPGDYYVEALSGAFADPNAAGGFAVTFFPGTSKASSAQVVHVSAGQDALATSFQLEPAAAARVSGTVVDGNGRPLESGTLMLMPSETTGSALVMIVRSDVGAGGQFMFRNVPPGVYTIQAIGTPALGGNNLPSAAFGYLTFTVDGRDLDTLIVTVPASRTLRGHITFDGDMATVPKTTDVSILMRQVNFESAPMGGGPTPVTIRDDWTFELNAMSGLRMVSAAARPAWILERATLNGHDVTDSVLDFRETDVDGLEIVLTTRTSVLTGIIVDGDQKPVEDGNAVIFADDESKWTVWSRYVTRVRSGSDGKFTVKGLPAGTYLAVPVPILVSGEWQDPDYLRRLRASGDVSRFALTEEGTATIAIKLRK